MSETQWPTPARANHPRNTVIQGIRARLMRSLAWGIGSLALAASSPLYAQPAPASESGAAAQGYERLLDRAVEAFAANDFSQALTLFRQAHALRPNARVLRGIGISALRLEQYSEAHRMLSAALTHQAQPLTAAQRDEVTELLDWMKSSLGVVRARWVPPVPARNELVVDGVTTKETELWLTPGSHRIVARAPRFAPLARTIEVEAGAETPLELALEPSEPAVAEAAPSAPRVTPARAAASVSAEPQAGKDALVARTPAEGARADDTTLFERWWFWTAIGVVAAGGITTAVALSRPNKTKDFDRGGLGGVLMTLEHSR